MQEVTGLNPDAFFVRKLSFCKNTKNAAKINNSPRFTAKRCKKYAVNFFSPHFTAFLTKVHRQNLEPGVNGLVFFNFHFRREIVLFNHNVAGSSGILWHSGIFSTGQFSPHCKGSLLHICICCSNIYQFCSHNSRYDL